MKSDIAKYWRVKADLESLNTIPNVVAIELDVRVADQVGFAAQKIAESGAGLYGLVNNAGIGDIGFLSTFMDEELADIGEDTWSYFRPVVARYLEAELTDRYIAILPYLAPEYRIVEITPERIRGESIPLHENVIPSAEDLPKFIESMTGTEQ